MNIAVYRSIWRIREAREALLLGLVVRLPMWAAFVMVTLHVVGELHRSYGAAGLVETSLTLAGAVSGPWRGRRLDRVGLRRTMLPSFVVLTVVWAFAPHVGYWWLVGLVAVAGLFTLPSFSAVRQVLIAAVPDEQRKAALVLDSVMIEVGFMIGPVVGVLLATSLGTTWTLTAVMWASVLGGVVLYVRNPPLVRESAEADPAADATGDRPGQGRWLTPAAVAVLVVSAVGGLVLTGTDIGVVAALRAMGHVGVIGAVLAVWGLGSAIGGLVYGALSRPPSAFWLVGLLGLVTVPVALAPGLVAFTVLIGVAGLLCAPTITATVDELSRIVHESRRGEAMGWHGSAITAGGALGSPAVGAVIDHGGWSAGFLAAGGAGVVVAVLAAAVFALGSRRRTSDAGAAGGTEGTGGTPQEAYMSSISPE